MAVRREKEGRAKKKPQGRPPEDIRQILFGYLEPFEWLWGRGWLCLCHKCGNTDGCIVRYTHQLKKGTVTGCERCHPREWSGKGGRRAAVPRYV
jgi:hypothetical protein